MKIIIHLEESEGMRDIECEEENIRAAYREIVRKMEDVMCIHQIRYTEIEVVFGE